MNVSFSCPRCQQSAHCEFSGDATEIECPNCTLKLQIPGDAFADGRLQRCLVCPSRDLFIRKDFPQRLGVAIVVAGFIGSSIAWYHYHVILTFAILFATALCDLALYLLVRGVLVCYRCHAHYRGIEAAPEHGSFELATHERYRQQAARLTRRPAGAEYQPINR